MVARAIWLWHHKPHGAHTEAEGWWKSQEQAHCGHVAAAGLVGADLQDAFCHFPVAKEEVSNCVCPGLREAQRCSSASRPRHCSWPDCRHWFPDYCRASLRRAKAVFRPTWMTPSFSCQGQNPNATGRWQWSCTHSNAFGVNVAYGKGERGLRVTWIGVVFELDLAHEVFKLTVSQKMIQELLTKLKSWGGVGMIGLRE